MLPPDQVDPLASLKTVPIPESPEMWNFIRDRNAALRLGKALFWDMQVGSDGIQACASCHFHAGADSRSKNQLNPGSPNLNGHKFEVARINGQLRRELYPFHKLANPNDRSSRVVSDSDDITGSQGIFLAVGIEDEPLDGAAEPADLEDSNVFSDHVRQAEPRNTPTTINAVFNFRNFWDGRAQNEFNGVSPFGARDKDARVLYANDCDSLAAVQILVPNSSLASQAVGPPLSTFEMSFVGRTFPQIGRKMLSLRPLAKQKVSPDDSVLGELSRAPYRGISTEYENLIKAAFKPEYWQSKKIVEIDEDGRISIAPKPGRPLRENEFTQMEFNFSLYFGFSIQIYESTLVADDTPFDRYMEGNTSALSAAQKRGLAIFQGKGKCINCHGGPELTKASVRHVRDEKIERMIVGDGGCAVYDNGFYNIGVRRTQEDLGVGGRDPFGKPLSMTRLSMSRMPGGGTLEPPIGQIAACDRRANVDGAFKVPGLRNVELTAPYFHNGGQLTLRQVVDFYNRGGDFHEANIRQLDPDIQNLGLRDAEKDDLVQFLHSLTDERVRRQKAPFDHPQLFVPNGHQEDDGEIRLDDSGRAADIILLIPATGRNGGPLGSNFLSY